MRSSAPRQLPSQTRQALWGCLLGMCALLAAGCAGPASSPQVASPGAGVVDEVAHTRRVLARTRRQQRQRRRVYLEVRAGLDARGRASGCEALAPGSLQAARLGPRASTARAWCWLRTQGWGELLAELSHARVYHQVRGDLRRLAELDAMGALAAHHLGQLERRAALVRQTERHLQLGGPLTPSPRDVLGGDLPYLLGRLVHLGAQIRPAPQAPPLTAPRLLEAAQFAYLDCGRRGARAHAVRAEATLALDRGRLGRASELLARSLREHAEGGHLDALAEDLLVVIALADASGAEDIARAITEWLFVHDRAGLFEDPASAPPTLPQSPEHLRALMADGRGQGQLLRGLRALRRDARRAADPPEALLELLASLPEDELARLRGRGWAIAQEIGLMFAEQGRPHQARRYLSRAVAEVEAMRASTPDLARRQRLLEGRRPLYMALIHSYMGVETARLPRRDYRAGLRVASGMKARGLLDLMRGQAPPPAEQIALTQEAARWDAPRLGAQLAARLERWAGPSRAGRPAPAPAPATPALAPDEALLEYVIGERSGYVWVLREGERIHARRVAGRREIEPMFEELRPLLVDHDLDVAERARYRELIERLYVALIAPAQDLIVDADRLYIAPDDVLHELPFEVLARPSRRARPAYLVREHAVSYVPSARVLARLPRADRSARGRAALMLGAPRLEGEARAMPPGLEGLDLARLFPSLPGGARELEVVARRAAALGLRPRQRTGAQATEPGLLGAGSLALLHIATHGLSDAPTWRAGAPSVRLEQPALLLAPGPGEDDDGVLLLEELLRAPLRAELVVLSGCTTGRGWRTLGDGAYGFAGAFLARGARAVVASSWSVPDEATAALMERMYRRMSPELDAARALQRARLELLRAAPGEEPPPFYWAGFRVIGR